MVELFASLGFGQWLRYVTALVELSGGALLLSGRLEYLAALALAVIMVGATVASVVVFDRSPIPPLLTLIAARSCSPGRDTLPMRANQGNDVGHGDGPSRDRSTARARGAAAERRARRGAGVARAGGARVRAAHPALGAARELGGAAPDARVVARPVLARRASPSARQAAAAVGRVRESARGHHGGDGHPRGLQLRQSRRARAQVADFPRVLRDSRRASDRVVHAQGRRGGDARRGRVQRARRRAAPRRTRAR